MDSERCAGRWALKSLSIRFRECFLLETLCYYLGLERDSRNRGKEAILILTYIQGIEQRMPHKFDSKRIYELPVLKHNIAAVQLIFQNVFQESLSEAFLQKAVEHNKLLTKLSMRIRDGS